MENMKHVTEWLKTAKQLPRRPEQAKGVKDAEPSHELSQTEKPKNRHP